MDLKPFIEKSRKNIKQNSIKNYSKNIFILNGKKEFENLDFLKDVEEIKNRISEYKDTTKRNYLTSIVVSLKAVDENKYKSEIEQYVNMLRKMNEEISKTYEKGSKTEKEKKNYLTYEELKEIQHDYKKKVDELNLRKKNIITPKQNKLLLYYLISSLYTLQDPLRLNWADLLYRKKEDIKDLEDDKNYFLDAGTYTKFVILNDFKNIKQIGKQKIKLSRPLAKVINLYRKFNKGEYLLLNTRGFTMSPNSLSKLLPIVFKKGDKSMNLNLIRKARVADLIDAQQIKKEKELANNMLHSIETQKEVYLKTN
tara:strand:+ start:853 stop:1785 length:933 start_codon:yes stop_codon:yes gene_type:complete